MVLEHNAGATASNPSPAVQSCDVVLHGERLVYKRIAGQGPAIVLVHGVGASSSSWDAVLRLLAARGANVIALDLPGHGESDKPRGDYSLGALASTIRDLLDYLNISSCVLVGHSLGGGIAMQFVYQFPERVDKLVLVSSGGLGPEAFHLLRAATLPVADYVLPVLTNKHATRSYDALRRGLARFGVEPEALSEDSVERLRELNDPDTRRSFLATLRSVVDYSGQRVSAVSRLPRAAHLPALLIWGDKDIIIPMSHGERAHELLPKSEFIVFRGAGHEPHRYDPQRFVDVLLEFADRPADASPSSDAV